MGASDRTGLVCSSSNGITSCIQSELSFSFPTPKVVNTAGIGDGSRFGPGYVLRWVANGYIYTVGEGNSKIQSSIVTGQSIQNIDNYWVWQRQMEKFVDECKCKDGK